MSVEVLPLADKVENTSLETNQTPLSDTEDLFNELVPVSSDIQTLSTELKNTGSDTYDPDYTDNMDEDQAPDTSDTDTATVDSEAKSSATKKRRRRRRRKPTAASDTSSDAGDPSQE